MGHERLSPRACSHASSERLAGRADWSQGSLPLVLLRVHALLSPVRLGLVGARADRVSHPARHERRSDGADGADDGGARRRKTHGAPHGLRGCANSAGPLLGPVIAGAILQHASWRWLFLINLPVGALAIVLAILFLPKDREETRQRDLDLVGFALLSPGLVLFLYGSDHMGERIGQVTLALSVVLLAMFFKAAARNGDRALIDLRLFKGKFFAAASVTQFVSNGISFAGQVLIPIYLIRACGRSPSATGWLLAPLGVGMICSYPWIGALTQRFGIRQVSAGGAFLALAATLPLVWLAGHGLSVAVLACALFLRGVGLSAVGIPSISAAYASVKRRDLPMATTSLNIVQRLGGPTMTTLCATFLGWRLSAAPSPAVTSDAFAEEFGLLCFLHVLLFLATLRLPWLVPDPAENGFVRERQIPH